MNKPTKQAVAAIERKEQGSTRQSILQLLRHHGQMTATELSQELNIGAVGVRQHLALLERDGLVEVVGLRRSIGRPSHLYKLTPEAEQCFPKSYDNLALNVLNYIEEQAGEEAVTEALSAHAERLFRTYATRLEGKSRPEQVAELVNILNEEGHMSEYEQLDDGSFVITTHNCPIDCVARKYTQICLQEKRLYEELLGIAVVCDANIATGDLACRYHIPAS
jgi:predicted ArsR family transcriptional regulator